jgi:hypothetical protein
MAVCILPLVITALIGCKRTPTCEDAVDNVAKFDPLFKKSRNVQIERCRGDKWPASEIACEAEARDEAAFEACLPSRPAPPPQ